MSKKNYPDYHVCVEQLNDDSENNLERIGALWLQEKSDKVHASGSINIGFLKTRLVILENQKKNEE